MANVAAGFGAPGGYERLDARSLRRYYQMLRGRLWLILACVVLTTAIAVAYVEVSPKRYHADAQLAVQPVPATSSLLSGLPVIRATGDPTRDVLTASTLITNAEVARAVIQQLHLHTGVGDVLGRVVVSPVGQSNVIDLQAEGPSAREAQDLANAFSQQAVAVRSRHLHQAIANIIPSLRAEIAASPASERAGPGTLGDQLSQLLLLQNSADPTITVTSTAELPSAPFSPRTKLSIAAGLLAGLILGVGAAFAFHSLDPKLRRLEQLRSMFAAPILATIPRESIRKEPNPLIPSQLSPIAHEAYRTLRTILTGRAQRTSQAFLVTGSSPGEGKTTTAISLAVALAQGGARVILIEADLRRPTFARTLGLNPDYGTADVLIRAVNLSDALSTVRIEGTMLRVLAADRTGVALADRLSYAVARRLLDDAKELADFVVIDSPPLTAVIDALPLVQLADEVLVVARLGLSKLSQLTSLEQLLREQGIQVSGLVVVATGPPRGSYEYYGRPPEKHGAENNHPAASGSAAARRLRG